MTSHVSECKMNSNKNIDLNVHLHVYPVKSNALFEPPSKRLKPIQVSGATLHKPQQMSMQVSLNPFQRYTHCIS